MEKQKGILFKQWTYSLQVLLLTLVLLFMIILSAGMGYLDISFMDVVKILTGKITNHEGLWADMDRLYPVVVTDVRLPRILTSAIVGARRPEQITETAKASDSELSNEDTEEIEMLLAQRLKKLK